MKGKEAAVKGPLEVEGVKRESIDRAKADAEAEAMPGRLLPEMDIKNARTTEHLTNGVVHGSSGHQPSSSDGTMALQKAAGGHLTNGDHSSNAVSVAGPAPTMNGATTPEPDLGLPEELLQLIADNYWPMSTLIDRVTQECFNDLTELVGKLEDEGVPHVVNGVGGSAAANVAGQSAAMVAASVRKKQLLLDFANTHRNKFIRLMVILQWGRRAEEIQKLVKVRQWLNLRLADIFDSADSFGHLKQHLQLFKQPNPDIPTALEALSSGTASWIPDVSFTELSMHLTIADTDLAWLHTTKATLKQGDAPNIEELGCFIVDPHQSPRGTSASLEGLGRCKWASYFQNTA